MKDQAGFIVNALLFPYLNNAVRLLERRRRHQEDIDAAMKGGCGFPMGPFALLDLVGPRHVASRSSRRSTPSSRIPTSRPSPLLRRMVAAGRLGRKSGDGFYDYRRSSRPRWQHDERERPTALADADLLGSLHRREASTSCTAPTSPRARPACRSPSTCRPRPATTPTTPRPRGEVGKVGVPVAHLGHMRQLFDGIPLGEMNTSMTINATASGCSGLYLALAERAGRRPTRRCRARRRTTSSRSTCRAAPTSSRPSRRSGSPST